MEQQIHSHTSDPVTIRLAPLPFWKWSIAIFLLLVIPLAILVQQASEAFSSSAEMVRSDIGQQLDGLTSRIALELDVNTQLREIIGRFNVPYMGVSQRLYYLSHFRRLCLIPLPPEFLLALQALEMAHRQSLVKMEHRLRQLVPGIKLIKWDSEFNILADSDELLPRWAYQRLVMTLKQRIALFVFALALPGAVLFHLGGELLKDRQRIYENEAYKVLEGIKKHIEENNDYAFHYVENLGNELGNRLMTLDFDRMGRLAHVDQADSVIAEYSGNTEITAVYMLDSAAEMIFYKAMDRTTGKDMVPFVQALSKIKLRYTGNLRLRGKASEIGMVDLFLEASGGMSVEAVQSILKYRENKAFEFRFTNRRVCFFVGEFSRPDSDESYIVVVLLKDGNFERMFLNLMIDSHVNEAKFNNRVQLYYGSNNVSGDHYFRPANLPDPWFDYLSQSEETIRIGRLSESTRFSGVSIRDRLELKKDGRRCLFYSFRPSNLDLHSIVALYDYSEIEFSLAQLRIFIIVSFLVSFLIGYILARVMARSLIEPVVLLQRGVEQVESGNYRTSLIMPGQDELVELAASFNAMTQGLDERERMTRYLSRSAVKAVESGEDAFMGGKKVSATILFSDIRSFTTISESNSAEAVVSLLNDYFAVMNEVVEEHGGDIDKFIGDAVMALFAVSDADQETPAVIALNAVKCALAMMSALEVFNGERVARGLFPIMIGVGINSGEVIAGNIGSPGRMDRTVIGDTVNVASRLEGMSKLGRHTHVIISRATFEMVRDYVEVEQLAETSVKGKTSAVEMFEVISIKSYN